jgi:predicted transcriptional regulator
MVFGAALIWRGRVRSVWGQSRFSYETFRLVVKMRGAQTRLKLMHALNPPKNKLQLATALGIDWKAVDKHVQVLQKNGLIQTAATNGTATYYEVTEKGRSLLQVLELLNADATMQTELMS